MRTVVMEWLASGGGFLGGMESDANWLDLGHPSSEMNLLPTTASDLAALLDEGLEMLVAAAAGAADAGLEVLVPVAEALHGNLGRLPLFARLTEVACVVKLPDTIDSPTQLYREWAEMLKDADLGLVVAPELDGILEAALAELRSIVRTPLINCSPPCLQKACDKRVTAKVCAESGVTHPISVWGQSGSELDRLVHQAVDPFSAELLVKPAFGAGASNIVLGANWESVRSQLKPNTEYVVQEAIAGDNFSCHAVVTNSGEWRWQPLMRQDIRRHPLSPPGSGSADGLYQIQFHGAEPSTDHSVLPGLKHMQHELEREFSEGALGWIGFDLVRQDATGVWHLIECNARCTTSLSILSASDSSIAKAIFDWVGDAEQR